LYLISLMLSLVLYYRARMPNWTILFLPLSKRLHSIFVLRLFNDCWTTIIMQASILAFSASHDMLGVTLYSLALSVKMSILLYLPAVGLLLLKRRGLLQAILHGGVIILIQLSLGYNLLVEYPWSYLKGSFDLSRVFLYKWTVNWKIVDEATFLNPSFANVLLIGHVTLLVAFITLKWTRTNGGLFLLLRKAILQPLRSPSSGAPLPTSKDTILMFFTANLIGMTCARSLHYQFYSWYAQQLPALASSTKYPIPVKLLLLLVVEYSWNVFPATSTSSALLLGSNILLCIGLLTSNQNTEYIAISTN